MIGAAEEEHRAARRRGRHRAGEQLRLGPRERRRVPRCHRGLALVARGVDRAQLERVRREADDRHPRVRDLRPRLTAGGQLMNKDIYVKRGHGGPCASQRLEASAFRSAPRPPGPCH